MITFILLFPISELEISTPVEVTIETVEDKWAVRILNLWSAVSTFLSGGQIAREVPVFAEPFGLGAFVFGIIDELRYDMNTHTVTIAELKTRKSRFPPKSSQQEKDRYQVSCLGEIYFLDILALSITTIILPKIAAAIF